MRIYIHKTEEPNTNNHNLLLFLDLEVVYDPRWQYQNKYISQYCNTSGTRNKIRKIETLRIGIGRRVPIRPDWEAVQHCEQECHNHHEPVEYHNAPYSPTHC
jgi:hypothetical protein